MKFYCEDKETVLHELNSSADGLTSAEAAKRLEENGKNKLAEGKKESLFHRFLKQLAEPMTIILLVAAAISAGVEIFNGVQSGHWEFPADVVIILAVVLINAILGVFQESKAEAAIEALQTMTAATCKVLWAAMIGSLVLTTLLLEVPFLSGAFGFVPVGLGEYGIALLLGFLVIPIVELVKWVQRRAEKTKGYICP